MIFGGSLVQRLRDPKTGRIVDEVWTENANTTLGRAVFWGLFRGTDSVVAGGRITGAGALLKVNAGPVTRMLSPPVDAYPQLDLTDRAEVKWQWVDNDEVLYTPQSVELMRDADEGALAVIEIPVGDRVVKTANLQYEAVWTKTLRSGDDTGTSSPDISVKAGLAELLNALYQPPNAIVAEQFLVAALISNIALVEYEDPRQGAANEAPVVISNWRTRAEDETLPANAVRFDMTLDSSQVPQAGFMARGLELRLKWGGSEGSAVPTTYRTFLRYTLDNVLDIQNGSAWEWLDVAFGLVDAPPVA